MKKKTSKHVFTTLPGAMKKASILFYLLTPMVLFTGCTEWKWSRTEPITNNFLPMAASTLDPSGNLIVAGNYLAAPTYEGTPLTNNGSEDIVIAKHSPDGNMIWVKHFGGSGHDQNSCVATDHLGNILITGNYGSPTLDFGNRQTLSNHGGRDCYVAKFDQNGNILWAKGFGNAGDDGSAGIYATCDNAGNVYVTGNYGGAILDLGNGINISGGSANNDFVVKYNPSGTPLWAKGIFCSNNNDQVTAISVDHTGNVFVTGRFVSPNISFQGSPAPLATIAGAGTDNIFFAKYMTDGTAVWNQCLGAGVSRAITCDPANNVYMTGVFYGNNNEFGINPLHITAGDASGRFGGDFFVSKFQAGGANKTAWVWAKSAGGRYADIGTAISADNDVVWVGGFFGSTEIGDFGKPSTSIKNATTVIANSTEAFRHFDSFIAEFDPPGGKLLNVYQFGNDGSDQINSVSINGPLGHGVFVSGVYQSTSLTFEKLSAINKTPATSDNNWFIANREWTAH